MASDADGIRQAIEARIEANWTATPIEWPGGSHNPTDAAWIQPTILWGEAFLLARDADRHNALVGVLSVNVFTKPGTGYGAAFGHVDALRDLLQHQTVGDARFGAASGPRIVPGDTDWLQVNVSVPFEAYETVTL